MLRQLRGHFPVIGGTIVFLIIICLFATKNRHKDDSILIGIPDGAAGLLARYILHEDLEVEGFSQIRFEPYTLYDCCASAAQYAIGSGRLDVAILCPDAAKELLEKDKNFEIAGPVIFNSDVLITHLKTALEQPRIAVSQKRSYQREMVEERFGVKSSAVPMFHGAVPFAFVKGVVEGAILDITKTFALDGKVSSVAANGRDVCTHVLVIKKSIRNSVHFRQFLKSYSNAVREMEDSQKLLRLMQTYISPEITLGDVKKWKKMNVHFTYPSNFLPQG